MEDNKFNSFTLRIVFMWILPHISRTIWFENFTETLMLTLKESNSEKTNYRHFRLRFRCQDVNTISSVQWPLTIFLVYFTERRINFWMIRKLFLLITRTALPGRKEKDDQRRGHLVCHVHLGIWQLRWTLEVVLAKVPRSHEGR